MAGNRRESFAPIAFGLIAIGAVVRFSTITPADAKAYQQRFSAYLAAAREPRPSEVVVAPVAPIETVVEDGPTPLAKALALSTVRPHLATYVPDPPPGWTIRDADDADYSSLTGRPPIVWSDINSAIAEIETKMAAHLATQRDLRSRDRGFEAAHVTFESGDMMVMLSMRYLPARVFDGPQGGAFALLQDLMRGLCTAEYAAEEFAVVSGLPFEISDVAGAEDARRINAFLGPQIDIEILTNTDDAAVMEILSLLNIAALNQMLDTPLETVGSRPTTVVADAR